MYNGTPQSPGSSGQWRIRVANILTLFLSTKYHIQTGWVAYLNSWWYTDVYKIGSSPNVQRKRLVLGVLPHTEPTCWYSSESQDADSLGFYERHGEMASLIFLFGFFHLSIMVCSQMIKSQTDLTPDLNLGPCISDGLLVFVLPGAACDPHRFIHNPIGGATNVIILSSYLDYPLGSEPS
mmetsp:Transcript_16602/g.29639  ORF Transcript_16602/g.29639 Transcript_16602/m.29639 type:complete len:180 (+) Transcript_16602:836-1375(+)